MGSSRPFNRRRVTAAPEPVTPYEPIEFLSIPGKSSALSDPLGGLFSRTPIGVALHGSHSGKDKTVDQEWRDTAVNWAPQTDFLWHVTIGNDRVAVHAPFSIWTSHIRGYSRLLLGFEFAQTGFGGVNKTITDAQVRAFCWAFALARRTWPTLPMWFPTHSELDGTPVYGPLDGKFDVYAKGDQRADDLRRRIMARFAELGVR